MVATQVSSNSSRRARIDNKFPIVTWRIVVSGDANQVEVLCGVGEDEDEDEVCFDARAFH